ncbi:two-component sensor histidine kinase [Alistipes onderdonkii subsp. vulgaris]|uniref:Two-component sensor histidine kinase n=1 Tax=Alistipes onderdonkii subsp. vulgaris TaxID=2585117 RepID=A0ACA8QXY6_9BACT|nr:two-component sensor histidine kinase [Alistipes onderdonkii subsp. vulgaris]BBL12447.1 two-component sensor histidine kinase [Alistipes onderdonkii subsp. vulgaris]
MFPYAAISAPPKPAQTDSLLTLLPKTPDAADRGRIYVQLADLSGDSLELAAPYWEAALAEAHKAGDTYGCKDALDFLVRKFADRDTRRAEKYIALSDSILPGSRHALFRSSLYAYYLWKQMNDNNSIETVTRALEELKGKNYDRLTPEERIEWEFLTGLAIDFSSVTTEAYDNIAKAIPYVERALENLRKYPLEERLHLEKICHDELSDLYMLCKDKRAEEQIGQCIDLHRKWLAMDDRFERPHRDTTGYMMRAYAKMVYLRDLISRDKLNEYYQKCIGLARARGDMAEIYSTSARYYQCTGDYERAVAYIDSTITAYKSKGIKADLAPIYATQSYLYEKMGDYKNALKAVRTTNNIRFNERVEEAQSSLAEMQTLFEVGRLEFEKSRLTGRIRFIALLAGGILVLLLIGWSVYQYVMVRQLKQIRRQLTDANEEITRQSRRAMESEKMKTAFINSMCHEIRTPLNAINGFSDLLLEGDHDHDTRREFREQIWASTTALTTLLENMLELSRLVSSEEPLPLAETDLGLLCAERLQIQRELSQNPSVEYVLKGGGRGTCVIPTNETYMTRVIDNLLQNAAKFTAAGSVTVCCDKDDRTRKLRIRVTDTGIGIAPDKQEWVFDRFTKVDSFKPGSGIGLYLCRLIVTRLGGAIRVCPDYRAGCCIEITLPY